MFAEKLSRSAGLVFVLAALFGGAGAIEAGAEHATNTQIAAAAIDSSDVSMPLDVTWN